MNNTLNQNDLFIVIGGELNSLDELTFKEPSKIEFLGFYKTYEEAKCVWKHHSQFNVDQALKRYLIINIGSSLK